jgi:hypothetical protein
MPSRKSPGSFAVVSKGELPAVIKRLVDERDARAPIVTTSYSDSHRETAEHIDLLVCQRLARLSAHLLDRALDQRIQSSVVLLEMTDDIFVDVPAKIRVAQSLGASGFSILSNSPGAKRTTVSWYEPTASAGKLPNGLGAHELRWLASNTGQDELAKIWALFIDVAGTSQRQTTLLFRQSRSQRAGHLATTLVLKQTAEPVASLELAITQLISVLQHRGFSSKAPRKQPDGSHELLISW